MPLPMAPPMISPSATVARWVCDRAIQIASAITATTFTAISATCADWLSFCSQPKLIPIFQASTRSKNGVTLTTPRRARSKPFSSQSFEAWSATSVTTAAMMPARSGVMAGRSDVHPQRLPFAQSLGIARGDVGIVSVLADSRRDLPGAGAFGADGLLDHDRDAGHRIEAERSGRRLALAHLVIGGDADLGEIGVEQGRQHVAVSDIDHRRGLERGADVLGGAFELERAGDDASNV